MDPSEPNTTPVSQTSTPQGQTLPCKKNLTHLSTNLTPSHQTCSHLCANVIFFHFHPLSAGAEGVQLKKKKKNSCMCVYSEDKYNHWD